MAGTNPRDPAFSKILYCVPTTYQDADGNAVTETNAAVQAGVLSGATAITGTTTPANGVSANSRHFVPVNAPANDAGGIDYGNEAADLAAQRTQCESLIGERIPIGGSTATELAWTVYGNQ